MDKCKREKKKLYEYACAGLQNYFMQNSNETESFFIKRDENSYIREYEFESIQDLKEELNCMWEQDEIMQQCMQTILVAALKLKPDENMVLEGESSEEQIGDKLPSYIYNM